MQIDSTDRRILVALQRDGRLTNLDLARQVGLSPSPCLRRVRQLEEEGIIDHYAAVLNPVKVGLGVMVFVRVWLTGQDQDTVEHFIAELQKHGEVVEAHLMAGDCDYLLRVVAADLAAYRKFQSEKLARIKCVQSLKTDIPMETVKLSGELPIPRP